VKTGENVSECVTVMSQSSEREVHYSSYWNSSSW